MVTATRPRRTAGGLAAFGALAVLSGCSDDPLRSAPSPPAVAITTIAPDTSRSPDTTRPDTTALPTTARATSVAVTTAPVVSSTIPTTVNEAQTASVSFVDPPPELAIRPLATVQVPEFDKGRYSAAIGDLGVAVSSWLYADEGPSHLDLIGFDGTIRPIEAPDGVAAVVAYGPGDVVYASRPGVAMTDFAIVAIAGSGANQGAVVASTPQDVNRFIEYPPATFGHTMDGILDRRFPDESAEGPIVPFVDVDGHPTTMEFDPAWYTLDSPNPGSNAIGGTVRSSTGTEWLLAVDAAPDRADSFVGNSMPSATSDGAGVYWTAIGPDAATEQDLGEPTMWVIANTAADGSARWWSLPVGWEIAASDVWGTVLVKQEGTTLTIAIADFGSQAG